jgi:senataxin
MSCQLPVDKKYEILVIDEAANLKECESMIPLKLLGINKLFLAGDDK